MTPVLQIRNAVRFIARGGQIIDASIVTVPVQHPQGEESEAIKRGGTPK